MSVTHPRWRLRGRVVAALPSSRLGPGPARTLAGVGGAPRLRARRSPRAQALPAHGLPHPLLRCGRPVAAAHPAVAVGPRGPRGALDQGVRLIRAATGRPRQQPRPVPVGAPRDTERKSVYGAGPPSPRAISPLYSHQPRREARRRSPAFWVAHQLLRTSFCPSASASLARRDSSSALSSSVKRPPPPAGRAPSRPGRHLQHGARTAPRPTPRPCRAAPASSLCRGSACLLGEEPEGLPPRLLRVLRVLLVGAGPGHPGPRTRSPLLPGPLPLPERLLFGPP